jgi:hypothetical protein
MGAARDRGAVRRMEAERPGHESGSEGLSEYLETKLVALGGLT